MDHRQIDAALAQTLDPRGRVPGDERRVTTARQRRLELALLLLVGIDEQNGGHARILAFSDRGWEVGLSLSRAFFGVGSEEFS